MCDQFHKALRRKVDEKTLKQHERKAIKCLDRENINQENQSDFFDMFVNKLEVEYPNQKINQLLSSDSDSPLYKRRPSSAS